MEPQYGRIAGFILSGFLGLVAILHVYWAIGGRWGFQESIGEGNPPPATVVIWAVAIGLGIACVGILGQIGVWGTWVPAIIFRIGAWLLAFCLLVVTFLNASTGRPWEMFLIAPFCAVLTVLSFIVARMERPSV